MPRLKLQGYIVVLDEDLPAVLRALPIHIQLTQAEEGCLIFQVLQDKVDSNRFDVYEEFVDKDAFEQHQLRVKNSAWGEVTTNARRHYTIEVLDDPPITIREENEQDETVIRNLTEFAFRGRPYAGGDEHIVIDRLRANVALTLSLVAVQSDEVIGQITFSPALVEDSSSPWFALGPVSVLPSRQGEGVGSALIEEGLDRIKAMGARGCILTGDPNYYKKFGFRLSPENCPKYESEEYFQLRLFIEKHPRGQFSFHRAFYVEV